jgi:hypothetical protein
VPNAAGDGAPGVRIPFTWEQGVQPFALPQEAAFWQAPVMAIP